MHTLMEKGILKNPLFKLEALYHHTQNAASSYKKGYLSGLCLNYSLRVLLFVNCNCITVVLFHFLQTKRCIAPGPDPFSARS